jgi:endonuclease/exonuclease/phosphatase family metal-dependent hydrolase
VRRVLLAFALLALALAALVLAMAGGVQRPRVLHPPVERVDVAPRPPRDDGTLRVVVWNLAWGYGRGSEGTGPPLPRAHFDAALARIAAVLSALDPDLALLQEVDLGARRSHGVDQARALAALARLPHLARAESWTAPWVPFPYGPPSANFGTMRSGGAVLSRFPLSAHRVELLPKPAANPPWYNLFYLFRYIQEIDVALPGGAVAVTNVHLEAFDLASRRAQARRLATRLAGASPRAIVGGDLNAVPPEAEVRHAYPDEPRTDHREDDTVALLRAVAGLADAVPAATYSASPGAFHTFPAEAPNRMLDHLFAGAGFEVIDARVVREAGTVSDHLPLLVSLRAR